MLICIGGESILTILQEEKQRRERLRNDRNQKKAEG